MRFMKCDHRLHHVRIERILKWSYFWHSYGYSFFFLLRENIYSSKVKLECVLYTHSFNFDVRGKSLANCAVN